jgi:hypothetical protein
VRTEVDRRRQIQLQEVADGTALFEAPVSGAPRVLDLAVPDDRHRVAAVVACSHGPTGASEHADAGARADAGACDAIVTAAGLARFADLGAAVEALDWMLAPGGVLLAIEPAPFTGLGGLLAASLGTMVPAARGAHLARDLQATLRAAGFTITDAGRFTMPTLIWPLRPFVQLRAVRTADIAASIVEAGP